MNGKRSSQCRSILMLLMLLSGTGIVASAQVTIELKPNEKPATESKPSFESRRNIPEAALPCSPEETTWWTSLRAAGDAVKLSRGDKKDRKRFAELLQEGAVKSYRAPIADHKPIILSQSPPQYTSGGRSNRVSGVIMLQVELLPDGTVGEVKVLNKLGSGLDKSAIAAARKAVFLPAVKDGKFVSFSIPMQMSFNVY